MSTESSNKTAIVILGPRHSGVPELARCLEAWGYRVLARNEKADADPIVTMNERMLAKLGGAWDRPGPFLVSGSDLLGSREEVHAAIAAADLADAVRVIQERCGDEQRIVLGYPLMTILWPFWARALEAAGFSTRLILIHRNPLAVAVALRDQHEIPASRGLRMWLEYNLEAMRLDGEGRIASVLSYEDLLHNTAETLGGIGFFASDLSPSARDQMTAPLGGQSGAAVDLEDSPIVAKVVKETYGLLRKWKELEKEQRIAEVERCAAISAEANLLCGTFIWVPANALHKVSEPVPAKPAPAPRVASPGKAKRVHVTGHGRAIIVHYHLFKNAGTSVDEILEQNFGEAWAEAEFDEQQGDSTAVTAWLKTHPGIEALSSHTAQLPLPILEGITVLPIIFIRHPIDRLRSAYGFERKQKADTVGARLAKEHDFSGYLRARLGNPNDGFCRNFQTYRLSLGTPDTTLTRRARALRTLETLPFVGLVEAFDASMERFATIAEPFFPGFQTFTVRKNATSKEAVSLGTKLSAIKHEIGPDLYGEIEANNRQDLELFDLLSDTYGYSA